MFIKNTNYFLFKSTFRLLGFLNIKLSVDWRKLHIDDQIYCKSHRPFANWQHHWTTFIFNTNAVSSTEISAWNIHTCPSTISHSNWLLCRLTTDVVIVTGVTLWCSSNNLPPHAWVISQTWNTAPGSLWHFCSFSLFCGYHTILILALKLSCVSAEQ